MPVAAICKALISLLLRLYDVEAGRVLIDGQDIRGVTQESLRAAIGMVTTMIVLGVFYLLQEADFLGVVHIFVYTGAVMMLFLFVVMLVGVDHSSSLVETLKGQRVLTLVLSLAVVAGLCFGLGGVTFQTMLRNPLASPDIIGISTGASTAAVLALLTFGLRGDEGFVAHDLLSDATWHWGEHNFVRLGPDAENVHIIHVRKF